MASGKEDVEGWQRVKKGKITNNVKIKEKSFQEPRKECSSKTIPQEDSYAAHNPTNALEVEGTRVPQASTDPIPFPVASSPLKEHIILGSEIGAEYSEEGDTEASSPSGTRDQPKRGWKSRKKRREEQSYKDVVQGSQHTIPEMMNTRSGMKVGKTPKGGHPPYPGK